MNGLEIDGLSFGYRGRPVLRDISLRVEAGSFHRFYNTCRCMVDDAALRDARLKLADTTRAVLASGLDILGVQAPEKM